MDSTELKYWVSFNRIPRIGRVRFALLERHFGSLKAAWEAGVSDLRAAGLDSRAAQLIATRKVSIDPGAELERLAAIGARAITWHDPDYPPRLKEDLRPAARPVRPGRTGAGG